MQDVDDLVPEDAGQRAALTKALAGLPDDQRAIVELILAGRGEADVATTLNLPRSQVAAMMTAAMRAIRERLAGPPSGGSLPAIVALLALTSG